MNWTHALATLAALYGLYFTVAFAACDRSYRRFMRGEGR